MRVLKSRQRGGALRVLFFALLAFSGCGTPVPDGGSLDGQQQIIDQAEKALTTSDCATALQLILPLYNSANSDNAIRMVTASAYACDANIDFFPLLGTLVSNASTLNGGGLWSLLAETFPSVQGKDHVVEGALLAEDALQATLQNGIPVLKQYQTNPGTDNVGSVYASDRTSDSNIYMLLVSMAGIGGLESRNGNPSASYHKQAALPWATAATMTADGCAYAASILNLIDSIGAVGSVLPASEQTAFGNISTAFNTILTYACNVGLNSTGAYPIPPSGTPANLGGATSTWVSSGCTLTTGTGCPYTLRNRASCTGLATDPNSCAAAGIINFINSSSAGWQ